MNFKYESLRFYSIDLKLRDKEGNVIIFKPVKKEDGTYELVGENDVQTNSEK